MSTPSPPSKCSNEASPAMNAAVRYITPDGPRRVVRRPKTEAHCQEFQVPHLDGFISCRLWHNNLVNTPSADIVLLVHGWAANQTDLFNFVPALLDHPGKSFSALAMDLPAHGQSSGHRAGLEQLADGVLSVGGYFKNISAVIAHSIGCAASQLAIHKGLQTQKAVMLASPQNYQQSTYRYAQRQGLDEKETAEMIAILKEMGVRTDIRSVDYVPQFKVPALLVHSADDPVVPIATSESINSYWPDSRLLRVDGLGHRGILKDKALIGKVIEFLAT